MVMAFLLLVLLAAAEIGFLIFDQIKKSDKKTPENLAIIQNYYKLYMDGWRIDLRKCDGHSGIEGNEMADDLATGKILPTKEL